MRRDPEQVKQEAVGWYAHLCSGDATGRDREDHQRWCAAHPDNRQAWSRFEALQQSFAGMPVGLAAQTLKIASKSRRQAMRNTIVLLGAGGVGGIAYGLWQAGLSPSIWLADYHTRVGEQRHLVLDDGSLLVLNTDTAVDIIFDARQRLIRLHAGELLVETASHRGIDADSGAGTADHRPLVVATRHGRVRALGTRFGVRRFEDRSEATVLDRAVEVRPAQDDTQKIVLTSGQRMAFSAHELFAVRPADIQDDWSNGSLVVNDWALGDLIAELARYRHGIIQCAPEVATLHVSGAFPLLDSDRALALLERSLPVKVSFVTRFWASIGAA